MTRPPAGPAWVRPTIGHEDKSSGKCKVEGKFSPRISGDLYSELCLTVIVIPTFREQHPGRG